MRPLALQPRLTVGAPARAAPSAAGARRAAARRIPAPPTATPVDGDLEAQMEAFLAQQASKEGPSSNAPGTPTVPPGDAVLGADVVSDDVRVWEWVVVTVAAQVRRGLARGHPPPPSLIPSLQDAKRMCREIVDGIQALRQSRDMTVNEIRLTLAIESPIVREQREMMGAEAGPGVSRDDVAAALADVAAGRVPRDRVALRELHKEVAAWPFLGADGGPVAGSAGRIAAAAAASAGSEPVPTPSTPTGPGWRVGQARPKPLGRDPGETPKSLADNLPEWAGYGMLYLISSLPVIIAGSVVAVLFFNSLR